MNNLNRFLTLLLVLVIGFAFVGCDDDNPSEPEKAEYEMIQPVADAYVSDANQGPVVTAKALFDNINDGDATNDYFVVSVRSADHFALGHIPGAINIPWRTVAQDANLAQLPADQKLAVYCYTGHTGGLATAMLNLMGYEAYNMKWGMVSWTKDQTIRVASAFSEDTDAHDFTLETTVNAPTTTFDLPTTEFSASSDAAEIIQAACDYVATNVAGVTTAQSVFDNLNDGDTSNDPVIVSVRSATHYALGHIPGSINIPWREIAQLDKIQVIDPSKDVIVYCYTGHTGAVATAILNVLGYNATNMKFGIMSWTKDATVRATSPFSEETDANDFAVEN